jgi:hypothetical protein
MKSTTQMRRRAQLTNDLAALVRVTFMHAYRKRLCGVSEQELIIEHDIEAAYEDIDEQVRTTARCAIHTAVTAAERGIPFAQACEQLSQQIEKSVDKLLLKRRRRHPTHRPHPHGSPTPKPNT